MTDQIRCPSCTHLNAADASYCTECNFPLHDAPPAPGAAPAPAEAAPAARPDAQPPAFDPSIRRVRPIRPRRPGAAANPLQLQLWLVLGGMAIVMTILWVAWQGFQKNNQPTPVEGASDTQQKDADLARAELKRDSTNVNAQIALANVLYDTANWTEAIVHYRSALRLDPQRVSTIVDLGVCYYNLSATAPAESLFRAALELDPRQPVALFNLGIVSENRGELEQALQFYHRAMQGGPPQGMGEALNAAIQRVMQKTNKKAPAIPPGQGPGGASGF